MTGKIEVEFQIAELWRDYIRAKAAQARWEKENRRLKAELLDALGYVEDDPKPQPLEVHTEDGEMLGRVTVGTWKGLKFSYLKDNFPEVYAICETKKPTLKIVADE